MNKQPAILLFYFILVFGCKKQTTFQSEDDIFSAQDGEEDIRTSIEVDDKIDFLSLINNESIHNFPQILDRNDIVVFSNDGLSKSTFHETIGTLAKNQLLTKPAPIPQIQYLASAQEILGRSDFLKTSNEESELGSPIYVSSDEYGRIDIKLDENASYYIQYLIVAQKGNIIMGGHIVNSKMLKEVQLIENFEDIELAFSGASFSPRILNGDFVIGEPLNHNEVQFYPPKDVVLNSTDTLTLNLAEYFPKDANISILSELEFIEYDSEKSLLTISGREPEFGGKYPIPLVIDLDGSFYSETFYVYVRKNILEKKIRSASSENYLPGYGWPLIQVFERGEYFLQYVGKHFVNQSGIKRSCHSVYRISREGILIDQLTTPKIHVESCGASDTTSPFYSFDTSSKPDNTYIDIASSQNGLIFFTYIDYPKTESEDMIWKVKVRGVSLETNTVFESVIYTSSTAIALPRIKTWNNRFIVLVEPDINRLALTDDLKEKVDAKDGFSAIYGKFGSDQIYLDSIETVEMEINFETDGFYPHWRIINSISNQGKIILIYPEDQTQYGIRLFDIAKSQSEYPGKTFNLNLNLEHVDGYWGNNIFKNMSWISETQLQVLSYGDQPSGNIAYYIERLSIEDNLIERNTLSGFDIAWETKSDQSIIRQYSNLFDKSGNALIVHIVNNESGQMMVYSTFNAMGEMYSGKNNLLKIPDEIQILNFSILENKFGSLGIGYFFETFDDQTHLDQSSGFSFLTAD